MAGIGAPSASICIRPSVKSAITSKDVPSCPICGSRDSTGVSIIIFKSFAAVSEEVSEAPVSVVAAASVVVVVEAVLPADPQPVRLAAIIEAMIVTVINFLFISILLIII